MEDKGVHTGKRKRGILESMQAQAGQEDANRDEAVTRAATDPDTEVGMTVRYTLREHDKQGGNKENIIGSPTDRRMSAYSADNDDTRKEPTQGTHGVERVSTQRRAGRGDGRTEGGTHAARKEQNPACIRSDLGLDRRAYTANKQRASGSMMTFARSTTADREGRCEHRTWWIG